MARSWIAFYRPASLLRPHHVQRDLVRSDRRSVILAVSRRTECTSFTSGRWRHEDAMPLIVTHGSACGWPIEQLKIIDPLTNPTAHGASVSDAFHVVIPSMAGYGFSAEADYAGSGPRSHGAGVGGADEAPRVQPIRGARR